MYCTHSVCKMHRKWELWKPSKTGVFSILFNGLWRRNERNGILDGINIREGVYRIVNQFSNYFPCNKCCGGSQG